MTEHEQTPLAALHQQAQPGAAPAVPDLKDMGFGSVLGGAKQQRILHRDGTFSSRRVGYPRWSFVNGYHAMLTMTWRRFLGMVTVTYAAVNALFAFAYLACGVDSLGGLPPDRMGGPFLRAFFFSVETFATIGYGHVFPIGTAANWLVSVEALVGILAAALLTGLVFARFSRPTARLLFSRSAVVAPYQGRTGFMFRIANARSNQLMELEAKVMYSRLDGAGRRYDQLKLERTRVVFFPLSWTIVHPIDETSPLWGLSHHDLVRQDVELDILIAGIDETFAQLVHARTSYKPDEIVFGARFSNIYNPTDRDGTTSIDVSRLSDIEPAPIDEDGMQHTQTFRHTGHFTGFVAPPPGR
ncbi:MAG TPA: ion channel [Gemmatimonadaceae bacterium]